MRTDPFFPSDWLVDGNSQRPLITMKLKLVFAGCGFAVIGLVLLLHFGPPGIKAGEDRILGSTVLTGSNKLFLVAHRTGHPIDAYEVSLFRVDSETNVFVSWLGYEDGYWWGSSLHAETNGDKLDIEAFWQIVGTYSLSDGLIRWKDKQTRDTISHRIDGVKVSWPVPKIILTNNEKGGRALGRVVTH